MKNSYKPQGTNMLHVFPGARRDRAGSRTAAALSPSAPATTTEAAASVHGANTHTSCEQTDCLSGLLI